MDSCYVRVVSVYEAIFRPLPVIESSEFPGANFFLTGRNLDKSKVLMRNLGATLTRLWLWKANLVYR